MVARICPIVPLLLLVNTFGPIRDTIKSTIETTGTKSIKNALKPLIPELETVPWNPHVKLVNSPSNTYLKVLPLR